jgi:hypothetical protein
VENRLHWVLDVIFREDLARFRTGDGPQNMANHRECQNFCVRGVFSLSPDWASHCIEGTASPASSYTG